MTHGYTSGTHLSPLICSVFNVNAITSSISFLIALKLVNWRNDPIISAFDVS